MGGREGQYGSPPPFFKLKKIPQEMTHTQREEGTGPQRSDLSGSAPRTPGVGKGVERWARGWVLGWHN